MWSIYFKFYNAKGLFECVSVKIKIVNSITNVLSELYIININK